MSHSVESVFTQTASTYDADRAKLIPGFDQFYATAVRLIPADADHILDLGAGTGLLSAFVRERFPDAYLHLIDNSREMLLRAEERFRKDQEAVCQLGDYTICNWHEDFVGLAGHTHHYFGGDFDAIVSALSIHHLTDDAKQALFLKIFAAVKPGGVFLNAEQILQPTPELEATAKQQWLADIRALGATETQIEASLFRQTEDRCATIADQLTWLREAGFSSVHCAYEQGRFAVLAATKKKRA